MPINAISSSFSSFAGQLLTGPNATAANRVVDLMQHAQDIQNARRASQSFNREASDSIRQVLTNVRDLASSARELDPDRFQNAFQLRSAASSDEGVVTATAERNAASAEIAVRVDQLAREQLNTGTGLTASATTGIQSGANTFQISSGGETRQITVNINAGDTNEQALNAIATAINQTDNLDIEASVLTNTATGNATIQLRSADTGAEGAFTIQDVTGNAVATTGIANVQQTALNAIAVVDGTQIETGTNQISLDDNRVQLNLEGVSSTTAT